MWLQSTGLQMKDTVIQYSRYAGGGSVAPLSITFLIMICEFDERTKLCNHGI